MGPGVRRDDARLFRRPGLEPGPIRRGPCCRKRKTTTSVRNNFRRWLWVPAFAGTTQDFFVVPALSRDPYAAAHVAGKERQPPAYEIISAGGYGSRRSPGRRKTFSSSRP